MEEFRSTDRRTEHECKITLSTQMQSNINAVRVNTEH